MIIYRNKHIPVQGFKAFFFCGILFVRGNAKLDDVTMNHESIHSRQWAECGVTALIALSPLILIGLWWLWLVLSVFAFYILYGIEWLVKLFIYKDSHKAYRNTSFEREAYKYQNELDYDKLRNRFEWLKHI